MNDSPPPFMEAFDLGRGLQHGFSALKRCFPVLFVGGCLLASGNRLWLALYTFLYWIMGLVMGLAGFCMCCVGALLSQPVGIVIRDFGFTEGFLRFARPADEVAGWTVHQWSAP